MDPLFVRTILLTLLAVAGATCGETLLSIGMKRIGEAPEFSLQELGPTVGFYAKAFTSPFVLGGIVCLAVYFFTFLQLMSWADLSLVLPMTALTFILATMLARFWLGETVTWVRWMGCVIITVGVGIVAYTGHGHVSSSPLPAYHATQEDAPVDASTRAR